MRFNPSDPILRSVSRTVVRTLAEAEEPVVPDAVEPEVEVPEETPIRSVQSLKAIKKTLMGSDYPKMEFFLKTLKSSAQAATRTISKGEASNTASAEIFKEIDTDIKEFERCLVGLKNMAEALHGQFKSDLSV